MKKGMVFVYGIFMFLLAGCAQDSVVDVSGKTDGEFRVYQTLCMAVDTGDGFYYSDNEGFLKYFDYQAKKSRLYAISQIAGMIAGRSPCRRRNGAMHMYGRQEDL